MESNNLPIQVKLYNQDGNVSGEMAAPQFLLAPWNSALVHQIFKGLAANRRNPIAHTKNRAEVSGGGKKPWRQKGTGRARQGSIRSPLWRHGGVTFGPRNTTDFSQKLNKKMAQRALAAALARKLKDGKLKIVQTLSLDAAKTKLLARIMSNFSREYSTLLVLSGARSENLKRAAANLNNIKNKLVKDLNVYDVLTSVYVIMDQDTLQVLADRLNKLNLG